MAKGSSCFLSVGLILLFSLIVPTTPFCPTLTAKVSSQSPNLLFHRMTLVSVHNEDDENDDTFVQVGDPDDFVVTDQYVAREQFDLESLTEDTIQRLELSSVNVSLPIALTLLAPNEFPSLSKARKACRKGNIVIHRHCSTVMDDATDEILCFVRGRVGDRIYPKDIIGKQIRASHGSYSKYIGYAPPTFDLPVVYEDDHFAIVNKPPGIEMYQDGGGGRDNIRYALPYVLQPPSAALGGLRRPELCHRLDKPTCGLLVIGKTKPALNHISKQFHCRLQLHN